jgi:competence protein ComEC
MVRSRIFLYFCLSFLLGILINSLYKLPQILILGILISGILLISVFWSKKKLVVAGFCLLLLVLGSWRYYSGVGEIWQPDGENVNFIGTIVKEPDVRSDNIKLTIKTEGVRGLALVTADRYPEYEYGDKLEITGYLAAPPVFDDFSYKDYLAKDGIYSVIYYPKIEFLGKDEKGLTSFIYGKILGFKDKLRESIHRSLSPPQSSILAAMILGDKSGMSDELKDKLNAAGLRHITAISGMHVTIISVILMQALLGFGLWRGQAFYAALLFLALFVIMVGLPSSAVRAAIMAGGLLWAQMMGRGASAFRIIIFAALIMLALNPLLLKHDVGFQLSFLAVTGIIFLSPHIKRWLKKVPDQKFINLRSILAMTLAAQIFTLPVLILNFGRVSLLAPFSNVLVLPVLPFVLGSGFLFSIAGLLWQPLGWVLSWPAWLLLTYVFKITDWFSAIPAASLNF